MKKQLTRPISIFLLIVFTAETILPNFAWALTGGPSQPEVQSFEPVGTTQMVDLFSGDFNYNIPIMDIDGYPINLAYHSGVTMDQEASWVGLGWNLNPGVINRNMRGIPDDFNGDKIVKDIRHKNDVTVGIGAGVGVELFGIDAKKNISQVKKANRQFSTAKGLVELSLNLGINYNNYRGIGFDFGITPSFSRGDKVKTKYSLSLNYSSQGGASLQPAVGVEGIAGKTKFKLGGSVNINSREGLKTVNIGGKIGGAKVPVGASYNSFSTASYIPSITMPMQNSSSSFKFKMGTTIFGMSGTFDITGYYSEQWLADNSIDRKAYGMQYLQNSNNDENILDFNREKDGSFSTANPTIGIPQLTQDLYSYSAQGIGGMFKTYRNDIPVVSDPATYNDPSYGNSLGFELGVGNFVKFGADIMINYSKSNSRRWRGDGADIFDAKGIKSSTNTNNALFESAYFKNIGEKTPVDPAFNPYTQLNDNFRMKFMNPLNIENLNYKYANNNYLGIDKKGSYHREARDKRDVYIKKLSNAESDFCINKKIVYRTGMGPGGTIVEEDRLNSGARKQDHNSEMTVLKADGTRYVYGIAAYNTIQKEYSFTNAKDADNSSTPGISCETGEVAYDSTFQDFKGIDQHKEIITTPGYAHSYLLTDILSPDYQDVDANGPSVNDIGTYTKINYLKINDNYKWRVPYNRGKANYNENLKSDEFDDNANFVYGTKEIWHVHSIEGKNQVAYFYISARNDGYGVLNEHGGRSSASQSYKLDSVTLYAKNDLIHPIKTAVFEYDYYLCPNVPNNVNMVPGSDISNAGKLTLRKVYFKYGTSNKGKYNSYKFDYNDGDNSYNKPYHLKGYDVWGNYKPAALSLVDGSLSTSTCNNNSLLLAKEFPYVEQDKTKADVYVAQWTLSKITLPSGGAIEVQYESDDYAYVQDRKAMQMYRLKGFSNDSNGTIENRLYGLDGDLNNNYIFLEVPSSTDEKVLVKNMDQLQYNVLVDIDGKNHFEYIRGYAKFQEAGVHSNTGGVKTIWVKIETVNVKQDKGDQINPISAAGFNFTRLNLPYLINPDGNAIKSGTGSLESFGRSLYGFWPEMYNLIRGQNFALIDKEFCQKTIPKKSWIRLNNTNGFKLGGGSRVKKIISNDNWAAMEGTAGESGIGTYRTNKYTQIFDYTIEEGKDASGNPIIISSGVASWEPQVGADENPFKELANVYNKENTFIPDEEHFTEKPYGENYFPSAGVGYSRVTVKSGNDSYTSTSISRNGTGKTVNDFYTAKDFPTIVPTHELQIDEAADKFIWTLLYSDVEKNLKMAQSHRIELNDMHGKPKATWNYNHKNINSTRIEDAYSGITYEYFESERNGQRQLENKVYVASQDGTIQQATVGVDAEVVIDSREFNSYSFSGGVNLNLDNLFITFIPLAILTGFPDLSSEETQFQSASSMKVINKYGILKKTTAYEEGAALTTENTVFDAQTGEVLVTKTQNEFDDYIYNTTYPAHWVYDGMGQAYKNQGAELDIIANGSSLKVRFKTVDNDPNLFLNHGDQIKLGSATNKYWIYKHSDGNWKIIDENGLFTGISSSVTTRIKIMDSGRKNMQSMPIATYTQLSNPASNGTSLNNNNNILNVSVTEYDSLSRMQNCFTPRTPVTYCTLKEAQDLMDLLIYNGYFSLDSLNYASYRDSTWHDVNINLDTIHSLANVPYQYTYKKINPNATSFKASLFIKRSGNNDTNYNYTFAFKSEPIDITIGCTRYKTSLEAGFINFNNSFSSISCGSPSISYQFPTRCSYTVDKSLTNSVTLQPIFYGAPNTSLCQCAFFNSGSNPSSNYNQDSGVCFEGNPGTFAYVNKLTGSSSSWPAPYTGFQIHDPQAELTVLNSLSQYRTIRVGNVYAVTQYLEQNVCNPLPVAKISNPFTSGLQNNWKVKRNWAYVDRRNPGNSTTTSNIRSDGTYATFDNFWQQSSTLKKPVKTTSNDKWQFTKEVTKYNTNGLELESKNALNIYNASIYGFNNTIPVAVANNARYNQILAYNFEQDGSITNQKTVNINCPAQHGMFDLLQPLINTDYYHTGNSSYRVSDSARLSVVYTNAQIDTLFSTTGSSLGYITKKTDQLGVFEPSAGKYVLSTWVKVGTNPTNIDYSNAGVQIILSTASPIIELSSHSGYRAVVLKPAGPIIDGWQRIEGTFTINSTDKTMMLKLFSTGGTEAYFDDLRIQPFNAAMNTYAYDLKTLRIMAELDDNNYATFYEYDNEGNLVRIKKETEKGIVTIKEARNSFKKIN